MSEIDATEGNASLEDSDDSLRRVYGDTAVFSHVGNFTLVHLDNPTREQVERRTAEFRPDDFFLDDCPLCCQAKQEGGHVVFDADVDVSNGEDVAAEPA
jgi:hypothetical protein